MCLACGIRKIFSFYDFFMFDILFLRAMLLISFDRAVRKRNDNLIRCLIKYDFCNGNLSYSFSFIFHQSFAECAYLLREVVMSNRNWIWLLFAGKILIMLWNRNGLRSMGTFVILIVVICSLSMFWISNNR